MAAAATVLGLLLLNALFFLGEVVAYGTWYDGERPAGLYISEDGARPRLRPGVRLNGLLYRIHTNSLGFRGPELASPKPRDGLRLWCLGGSTTFDIYAPDDERAWPAQAGAMVQEALPGRAVEVLNAGVPGEIMEGSLADLRRLGRQVRPDVVVIYHGPNDLRQVLTRPAVPPPPTALQRLMGSFKPAMYRVLLRNLQSSAYLQVELPAQQVGARQLGPIRQRLEALIRESRALGATPLLATHALRAPPDAAGAQARAQVAESALLLGMDAESTLAAFAAYNQLVVQLAREHRLPLADVRAAVPPDGENWGDATHFRAPGSARAARGGGGRGAGQHAPLGGGMGVIEWLGLSLLGLSILVIGALVFGLRIVAAAASAQRRRVVTGAEAMPGEPAVVIAGGPRRGRVRFQGEIWQARWEGRLEPGQPVRVLRAERLVLWVCPDMDEPD